MEIQNKIQIGVVFGGRQSGEVQKEAKMRHALAVKCSVRDQRFIRAQEIESLLVAAAVAQLNCPCQKA